MGKYTNIKYLIFFYFTSRSYSLSILPEAVLLLVLIPSILSIENGPNRTGDYINFPNEDTNNNQGNRPTNVPYSNYQLANPAVQNGVQNLQIQSYQPTKGVDNNVNQRQKPQNSQHPNRQNPNTQFVPIVPEAEEPLVPSNGMSSHPGKEGGVKYVPLKTPEHSPQGTVRPTSPVSAAVTAFGMDLMRVLEREHTNVVLSPYSIALVLALLQQGAEGEALAQISRALGLNQQDSRESFRRLISAVRNRRSRSILKITTSIFYSHQFDLSPQYRNDAVQFFSSDVTALNFDSPQFAAQNVNEWVSLATQGYIQNLVGPDAFSPETLMVLANGVFFKGLWNNTFSAERTLDRPFFLGGGGVKVTSFMHNSGKYQAGRDQKLNADFIVLPFEGLQYSMILVVPSEKSDVATVIRQTSHDDLLRILASQVQDVVVSIPKFDIRADTNLVEPLKALGIRNIFTENSGLALGSSKSKPRVTAALHAAILSIDERGGSAAATTLLAVSTLSIDINQLEFRFHADRPFLSILWDNETNVPLFLAKIVEPVVATRRSH